MLGKPGLSSAYALGALVADSPDQPKTKDSSNNLISIQPVELCCEFRGRSDSNEFVLSRVSLLKQQSLLSRRTSKCCYPNGRLIESLGTE